MKGDRNGTSFRSVLGEDRAGVVISDLLACSLLFSMDVYGIGPDGFQWPGVHPLSQLAPGVFGKLSKGRKSRMGPECVLPSYPQLRLFSRQNIPFPLSALCS